jgi:hypothetical protein
MGGGVAQGPRDDSRGGRILRPGGGGKGKRLMPFFELANSGEHVLLIPLCYHRERNTVQHSATQSRESRLNMRDLQTPAHPCNT